MAGRRLGLAEREEIAVGRARGESCRQIAGRIGRNSGTVSRELRRNRSGSPWAYRAFPAQIRADARARRPKPRKLLAGSPERGQVVELLKRGWSPGQIAGRLKRQFPERAEMQVSHETIYQALFVQAKGGLRRELVHSVRCGRARRRPRASPPSNGRGRIPDMVNISERPAEAADRGVPGHWEGDLVIGAYGTSQIATLVERSTRFAMLIALPRGRTAAEVSAALGAHITTLPSQLARSLTWDQGMEMSAHAQFRVDTGVDVYFCDPHSPWQRGTNENTNRLVRYYYPKGETDFSAVTQAELDQVAHELNTRPRMTLDYQTPAEAFNEALVATTD